MRATSYRNQVINKYKKAFQAASEALDQANRDVIVEENYWAGFEGRRTLRSNGSVVVGAFRNIVDTGDLQQSQTLNISSSSTLIRWDSPHAAQVFFGGVTETGTYVPGRNWVWLAIQNVDLAQTFKDNF